MADTNEWCRRIALILNRTLTGKMNCTGTVTLTANAASTVVTLAKGRLGQNTVIKFDPLTANAAADLYGGGMYVTTANRDVLDNQFTITHPNTAAVDKSFRFALVG
jgi:FlaG/FlaF family flagellin (archaellin)